MRTVAEIVLFWSLAALLLAHLTIVARLAIQTKPRRWALVALVVPPLAPWWAHQRGWRVLSLTWLACTIGYALALAALLNGVGWSPPAHTDSRSAVLDHRRLVQVAAPRQHGRHLVKPARQRLLG